MQDVATAETDVTEALRESLLRRVGSDRLDLWFGSKPRLIIQDRTLIVEVATPLFKEWLHGNFRDVLRQCCNEVLGHTMDVKFRVNTKLTDSAAPSESPQTPAATQDEAVVKPKRPSSLRPQRNSQQTSTKRFAKFNSFVTGHANKVAFASAQMVAERPGSVSPLFMYGRTGVGKTHLLESILSQVGTTQPNTTALYLAAEQFTSLFLEALHHSGLPSFRRKYRNVGLLILDDVQFFTGKNATLGELLHTIDTLLRKGHQVVLAADRPPAELDGLGPELTSRLVGGMVCRLDAPDHDVRLEIVRRYVKQLDIAMPADVQQLVASRLNDNVRELFGAVHRLHATSQALQQPITAALAEEALADLVVHSGRLIQMTDIERAVCEVFGLRPESLRSARKIKAISHPRMLAMWLARKYTRSALSEIGDHFGHRSHTTVISAQKRVDRWMQGGDRLSVGDQHWHIEEAIRRVEGRLKAG